MEEVMKEVNATKMHNLATVKRFNYFELINKYQLPKVIRIMAWILRIIINLKSKRKCRVVLSATERNNAMQKLIKIAQYEFEKSEQCKETSERLRLHRNHDGLLVCMGRIQGEHNIFTSQTSLYKLGYSKSTCTDSPWDGWSNNVQVS